MPTEYYITHECVESNRKEDFGRLEDGSITYSYLDNEPTYRVCVQQANHAGYSKLRCVDDYNQLIKNATMEQRSASVQGGNSLVGSNSTTPTAPRHRTLPPPSPLAAQVRKSFRCQKSSNDLRNYWVLVGCGGQVVYAEAKRN